MSDSENKEYIKVELGLQMTNPEWTMTSRAHGKHALFATIHNLLGFQDVEELTNHMRKADGVRSVDWQSPQLPDQANGLVLLFPIQESTSWLIQGIRTTPSEIDRSLGMLVAPHLVRRGIHFAHWHEVTSEPSPAL